MLVTSNLPFDELAYKNLRDLLFAARHETDQA